ncbi:hypothetical protein [Piscinibacter terrae]|nr:hypothetical protein [Albitalea terrae]
MATSSILGGERAASQAEGRDVERLGPSDSSDSGSDVQGELDLSDPQNPEQMVFGATQPGLRADSDSAGTGERGSALIEDEAREGNDILPDQVQNLSDDDTSDLGLTEAELDLIEKAELEDLAQQDLGDDDEDVS